jgi:hypothetical protein
MRSQVPDINGICDIGTGCVSPIVGGFNVKEAYGELLIPILKDVPFASALNLTVGDRYSKYSNFGSTNNTKFAIEYRPIEDLLLRGTVSKVFRAPTISDLYQGATSSAPQADRSVLRPGRHECRLRRRAGRRQFPRNCRDRPARSTASCRVRLRPDTPRPRARASRSTGASSTTRTGFRACRSAWTCGAVPQQ